MARPLFTGKGLLRLFGASASPLPTAPIPHVYSTNRHLMGTMVSIQVAGLGPNAAQAAAQAAFAEMDRLIAIFDRHNPDSTISQLNNEAHLEEAPPEFVEVLAAALHYSALSNYAFDITVLPLVELLEKHANPEAELHLPRQAFEEALGKVNPQGVLIQGRSIHFAQKGMRISLDALAKGYIVDAAAARLKTLGAHNYLINAGGDISAGGEKFSQSPWRVAIEDPHKKQDYPAVFELKNASVATSGLYERYYDKSRKHHHLVLPGSGQSPSHALSVSVKAPSSMQADALATMLSLLPQQEALEILDSQPFCACLMLLPDKQQVRSWRWELL